MTANPLPSASSALIVVDMQNGFCHPDGSLPGLGMGLADVDRAVARSAVAVEQARRAGQPVIFTRHVYRPGRADEGRNLGAMSGELAEIGGLAAGSWDGGVVDELGWTPDDLTVDKVRFDAFLWTSLDPLLAGLGVKHLHVCGVVTNVCVESTVRAAFMRDYSVTLLGDACAARTPRLHDLGLEVMGEVGLATVVSLAEGYRLDQPTADPAPAADRTAAPAAAPAEGPAAAPGATPTAAEVAA